MADLNPFSKVLQKHAGRAKERLLQNLGKADRTTDEDFDFHVKNFTKQQNATLRLQKELRNYVQCKKAMGSARRSLIETVNELYEPCWAGLDQFLMKSEILNKNYDDFCENLNSEILSPMGNYVNQFPEFTHKTSKRNRKLLDYDNCRHNLQNLETMKKREDAKICKAKEQLEDARTLFEQLNTELHSELPSLYESRVNFFASNLQNLFLKEAEFHSKDSQLLLEMKKILESLEEAHAKDPLPTITEKPKNSSLEEPEPEFLTATDQSLSKESKEDGSSSSGSAIFSTPPTTAERNFNLEQLKEMSTVEEVTEDEKSVDAKNAVDCIPKENVLYQVKGTYKYIAEDSDELSFNVGDIIDVIAYDDPEEQEDGWLMGVFEGRKGLFPANFTSRV